MPSPVVLVTGGTSGIGRICAETIANLDTGNIVVVASRSKPQMQLPQNVKFAAIDLLSPNSIRSFVSAWSLGKITSLVCNAGMNPGHLPPQYTAEGIETALASNLVGHAELFFILNHHGLLDDNCRITFVASGTHDPKEPLNPSPPHWSDAASAAEAKGPEYKDGNTRYATAKLATVMFALILARNIQAAGKTYKVVSFDPGFCPGNGSNLNKHQPAPVQFMSAHVLPRLLWILRAFGILSMGQAVAGQTINGHGEYYQVVKKLYRLSDSSEASYKADKQLDLWNWTLEKVSRDSKEKEAFSKLL